MQGIAIDEVTFHGAGWVDVEKGLLGWAAFTVNGALRVDGIAVRRTLLGRYTLSFPARETPGRRRFWVRPLTVEALRHLEREVFRALNLEEAP